MESNLPRRRQPKAYKNPPPGFAPTGRFPPTPIRGNVTTVSYKYLQALNIQVFLPDESGVSGRMMNARIDFSSLWAKRMSDFEAGTNTHPLFLSEILLFLISLTLLRERILDWSGVPEHIKNAFVLTKIEDAQGVKTSIVLP